MRKLRAFLEAMIKDTWQQTWDQQKKFYCNPDSLMEEFRLTERQKGILCTLDFDELWREAAKDQYLVNHPDFPGNFARFRDRVENTSPGWPDPGDPTQDPWQPVDPYNPCGGTPCCDDHRPPSDDDQHARWSGPEAKLHHVFEPEARLGQIKDLKISGEGILPRAEITLRSTTNSSPPIVRDSNDYKACNVRRTYIRVRDLQIPTDPAAVGDYDVIVRNLGWKKELTLIRAFRIRP